LEVPWLSKMAVLLCKKGGVAKISDRRMKYQGPSEESTLELQRQRGVSLRVLETNASGE